ncbi:MAG TPA: response regulator transcription factor [Candidatus Pelethocola excrementipullorum]|nr:response regulator transcription factor [Candidatus Pelethocola excrementipullorum]
MAKILAVDDEIRILRLIKNALKLNGHEVTLIDTPGSLPISAFSGYDLILLDVMMPDINGFDLLEKIRDSQSCPILFLTAKTGEDNLVRGLMQGADDYINKPFGVKELNARVEAHLRRESRKEKTKQLRYGSIIVDMDKRQIQVEGQIVELTKSQYNICEFLARNSGKVFTKEQIYEEVYSIDSDSLISTVTEHIRVARKKLKEMGCEPIETVWGVGYMWK